MSSQTQSLTPVDNLPGLARRIGPRTLVTRLGSAAAAVLREVWEIINAATDMRNELRRMAEECEATRPEHAGRLRQLANSNWED